MRYKTSITALAVLSLVGSAALVSAAEPTDRKPSHKPKFLEVDLNGDSLISKAELMAHAETRGCNMFDKLDADNHGQLNAEEFSKVKKRGGKGKKRAKFDKADTDGDGALSSDELLAQISTKASARVRKMINRADTNADGLLNFKELETAQRKIRNGNMFDNLDTNNDGQLNVEEFSKVKKWGGKGKKRGKKAGSNNGDGNN
jgi:Ca2+-binding EF-hand superfamily protein